MKCVDTLRLDYDSTNSFLDKCDAHMFKVKNWTLITSSAIIAYSISANAEFVVFVNLFLVPTFLYLELVYKSFQDTAIDHSKDIAQRIDRALLAEEDDDLLDGYQFGFGRKLQYPSLAKCLRILVNKNTRYIVNFYGAVVLFSMGAFLVGLLFI